MTELLRDVGAVMRTHDTPLGLKGMPDDEFDCCADGVLKVVLGHLVERMDELRGSTLGLPDGPVWVYTDPQVQAWLEQMLG